MSDLLTPEAIKQMRIIVKEAVREAISPFMTMDEVMDFYRVKSTKTIAAMEKRGEIPTRTKSGRWLRSEVNEWKVEKLAA